MVKPAVTNLEAFYRIHDELKASNVLGMVDYHKVYDEANMLTKSEYAGGRYGKIQHFSSLMTQRRDMLKVYRRWFGNGNILNINHYLGAHYIHLVSFMTGGTPKTVRATMQFGVAKTEFNIDTPDIIQTNVEWELPDGCCFVSYHISGWSDPCETAAMTFQQFHMLTENGHIFSDQRDRGLSQFLCGEGLATPNPYFFPLFKGHGGKLAIDGKYGFESIRVFLELVKKGFKVNDGVDYYPTFEESENVTSVLNGADLSLREKSRVVTIEKENGRYILR